MCTNWARHLGRERESSSIASEHATMLFPQPSHQLGSGAHRPIAVQVDSRSKPEAGHMASSMANQYINACTRATGSLYSYFSGNEKNCFPSSS